MRVVEHEHPANATGARSPLSRLPHLAHAPIDEAAGFQHAGDLRSGSDFWLRRHCAFEPAACPAGGIHRRDLEWPLRVESDVQFLRTNVRKRSNPLGFGSRPH